MNKKYVEEAPYNPGYEDAYIPGMGCVTPNQAGDDLLSINTKCNGQELEEWRAYKQRHLNTANKIVNFIKELQ